MFEWVDSVVAKLGRFLCARLSGKYRKQIRALARTFYNAMENFDYDFETNGERQVLLQLKGLGIRVVLDVGANVGNWSKVAAELFQAAEIHCFEIAPETFAVLSDNLGQQPRCVLNNTGLSRQVGEVIFNYCGNDSGLSSIEPVLWQPTTPMRGQVTTGSRYAAEKGIERIDFLKIDTESHDFFVLEGFEELLLAGKVRIIQFEYGRGSIDTKKLLKDHYDFLQQHGFVLGKIYPKYVDFRPYSYAAWDEDFVGPNFLAVKKSEEMVIYKLGGKPGS